LSRKLKPKPIVTAAKKQPPRWQRERSIALYIWVAAGVVIALVAGLVGYWAYDTYAAPWRQVVVRINDTTLDMDYYVRMLRVYGGSMGTSTDAATVAYQVLERIEDNEVIAQSASDLGVTVTPEEISADIDQDLSAAIGGNTTPTTEEMDELYAQFLEGMKISDEDYREIVAAELLREKVTDYIDENEVPHEAEQVYLHIIPMDDEELAGNVTAMLRGGGNFTEAAAEYSVVPEIAAAGGDVGWLPRGMYPELDDVIFSLEVGNVTGPLPVGQQYYIAMVSDTAESMLVPDEYRDVLVNAGFAGWLEEHKDAFIIEQYLDADMIMWAFQHV
jgi:hypothetical protein